MPYLIKRRSNNAAVTYRMFPVDNAVYYSVPANPAYFKGGKWTKPYEPDNFGGLINDYIEEYTPLLFRVIPPLMHVRWVSRLVTSRLVRRL